MGLIDTLARSGQPQGPTSGAFFDAQPGLLDEIQQARAAGWSWRQITTVLQREYGWTRREDALRRYVEGR